MKYLLMIFCVILISCSTKEKQIERSKNETFFISEIIYVDSITAKYIVSTKTLSIFYETVIREEWIPDDRKGVRIHKDVFYFWAKPDIFNTGDTVNWSKLIKISLSKKDSVLSKPKITKDTTKSKKIKKDSLTKN